MIKWEKVYCYDGIVTDNFKYLKDEYYYVAKEGNGYIVWDDFLNCSSYFLEEDFNRSFTYDLPDVSEYKQKTASEKQVDGNHYAKLKIQPMAYCLHNNLNYGQSNAIKYITRYKDKNGIQDLEKAIHCIELLIQHEKGEL